MYSREVEDVIIPRSGRRSAPVRIYASESDGIRPALIYFHGGGWVLCNLETHDAVCRGAGMKESGCVVVSVDYSPALLGKQVSGRGGRRSLCGDSMGRGEDAARPGN